MKFLVMTIIAICIIASAPGETTAQFGGPVGTGSGGDRAGQYGGPVGIGLGSQAPWGEPVGVGYGGNRGSAGAGGTTGLEEV